MSPDLIVCLIVAGLFIVCAIAILITSRRHKRRHSRQAREMREHLRRRGLLDADDDFYRIDEIYRG